MNLLKNNLVKFLFISLFLMQQTAVASTIIYDNGNPDLIIQTVSDFSPHGSEGFVQVADDFILRPDATTVTGVNWWGSYGSNTLPNDDFTIRLFNFISPGVPAITPFYEANVGAVLRTNTGLMSSGGLNIHAYSAIIPTIDLLADNFYYLSIINNTPGVEFNSWAWSSTNATIPSFLRRSSSSLGIENTSWRTFDTDVIGYAFNLTGPSQIPEPTTLALISIGLASIGISRKRKAD